jgi:hypothetical protein
MSDTPRTDAVHESNVKATDPNRLGVEDYLAMMDHARTLERQNAELLAALKFYADPLRYRGPNQSCIPNGDPYTPLDAAYRQDVTRDQGHIAREAIRRAEA